MCHQALEAKSLAGPIEIEKAVSIDRRSRGNNGIYTPSYQVPFDAGVRNVRLFDLEFDSVSLSVKDK